MQRQGASSRSYHQTPAGLSCLQLQRNAVSWTLPFSNRPVRLIAGRERIPARTGFESRTNLMFARCNYRRISWRAFVDTYRTLCIAPEPRFGRVLQEFRGMQIAAWGRSCHDDYSDTASGRLNRVAVLAGR